MLKGIFSLVAVVPVIAKADAHTAGELEAYRREVMEARLTFRTAEARCKLAVPRCRCSPCP
jgi:hypothetical protein